MSFDQALLEPVPKNIPTHFDGWGRRRIQDCQLKSFELHIKTMEPVRKYSSWESEVIMNSPRDVWSQEQSVVNNKTYRKKYIEPRIIKELSKLDVKFPR